MAKNTGTSNREARGDMVRNFNFLVLLYGYSSRWIVVQKAVDMKSCNINIVGSANALIGEQNEFAGS